VGAVIGAIAGSVTAFGVARWEVRNNRLDALRAEFFEVLQIWSFLGRMRNELVVMPLTVKTWEASRDRIALALPVEDFAAVGVAMNGVSSLITLLSKYNVGDRWQVGERPKGSFKGLDPLLELAGLEELCGGPGGSDQDPTPGDAVVEAEGVDGGDLEDPPDRLHRAQAGEVVGTGHGLSRDAAGARLAGGPRRPHPRCPARARSRTGRPAAESLGTAARQPQRQCRDGCSRPNPGEARLSVPASALDVPESARLNR
jgi:hypothetical protein